MNDGDVAVPRCRYWALSNQRAPGEGYEVKHVCVLQMPVAVMPTVQDHGVFTHHAGAAVSSSGDITTTLNLQNDKFNR